MADDADDAKWESLEKTATAMEEALGLPRGFLFDIVLGDDWSLVIKGHALIEATVTHLLAESIDPRLRNVFTRLALSNAKTGKIECAEAVALIDQRQRRFIVKFSELRNRLVHDVANVSFDFEKHIAGLDHSQRTAFADALTWYSDETDRAASISSALAQPKLALWVATLLFIGKALTAVNHAQAIRALRELRRRRLDEFKLKSAKGTDETV